MWIVIVLMMFKFGEIIFFYVLYFLRWIELCSFVVWVKKIFRIIEFDIIIINKYLILRVGIWENKNVLLMLNYVMGKIIWYM